MSHQKRVGSGLHPKSKGYIVAKRKVKLTRKSVLKMLAAMEASQNAGPSKEPQEPNQSGTPESTICSHDDFLHSGRTGRRNALADILGEHAKVTSSDLPSKLEALTTKEKSDSKVSEPGGSGTNIGKNGKS